MWGWSLNRHTIIEHRIQRGSQNHYAPWVLGMWDDITCRHALFMRYKSSVGPVDILLLDSMPRALSVKARSEVGSMLSIFEARATLWCWFPWFKTRKRFSISTRCLADGHANAIAWCDTMEGIGSLHYTENVRRKNAILWWCAHLDRAMHSTEVKGLKKTVRSQQ